MNILTVSWFSAGVSSAVATWMMCDKIDRIIYIHIDDQHHDSLRFVKECAEWFGKPIKILQSPYRTVAAAWKSSGLRRPRSPGGFAPCTNTLKKRVRKEWECENLWFNNLRYVWGMDSTEAERAENLRESMPDFEHVFPLIDQKISKEEAHGIFCQKRNKKTSHVRPWLSQQQLHRMC